MIGDFRISVLVQFEISGKFQFNWENSRKFADIEPLKCAAKNRILSSAESQDKQNGTNSGRCEFGEFFLTLALSIFSPRGGPR